MIASALRNTPSFLSLLLLILLAQGVDAMTSARPGKDCLFSEISGTITLNGEPAVGAHVKRTAGKAHVEGEFTDETFTDENGFFTMPAIWERNLLSRVFPMEFVAPQEIVVVYQGAEYDIWTSVKRKREENSESHGKPLVVQCELSDPERSFRSRGTFFATRCTWDVEVDPPFNFGAPGSGN
jgi:hypothetical protein